MHVLALCGGDVIERVLQNPCRRSGNLQSKPGKTDPFMRAESWLRQRKTAKVDELGAASAKSMLVRCLNHV